LVSDSAPLASLVQRLGRLNRVAACTRPPAPAIVVHDTTTNADDPVYGPARLATWQWLSQHSTPMRYSASYHPGDATDGLPASPAALRSLIARTPPEQVSGLQTADPYTPVLHPSIVD